FIRCQPDKLRRIEPPGTTGVKPGPRFRPQLIAITRQCLNFDSATSDWPEPASASFVPKIRAVIDRAGEDALSWRLDQPHAIGGRKRSVVRLMNALIRATSEWL